jgi:hypothetical protein
MIGLVRLASDGFGPTLGMALLYSLAAAILWTFRRPRGLRSFPVKYLVIGGASSSSRTSAWASRWGSPRTPRRPSRSAS